MEASGLHGLVRDALLNAALGWLLVTLVLAAAVAELVAGTRLYAWMAVLVAMLALVPPVAFRSARAMLPWEVIALAALPTVLRFLVVGQTVAGLTFSDRLLNYLAAAAVALIVAVELDVFTPVKMNQGFAILFATVATMAAAGVWAVAQYVSDLLLGTRFLLGRADPHAVEEALMWDFVAATVAGVAAGLLFELYFRRRTPIAERLPGDLPADVADEVTEELAGDEAGGDDP